MKRFFFAIVICSAALFLFCGDNGNSLVNANHDSYTSDTNAVRAILVANGLTNVSILSIMWDTTIDGNNRVKTLMLDSASLQSNKLRNLTSDIGALTALRILSLKSSPISTIPPAIQNLTSLELLDLSNCNIAVLPDQIGQLTSLTTLTLSNNHLTQLPSTIGNLTALKSLTLDSNNITSLPSTIGALSSIQFFSTVQNDLTALPSQIISLPNAVYDFEGNELCTIAPAIQAWITKFDVDISNQRCP